MAGTLVTDRIESDASYASSITVASPMVVSNTINMTGGSFTSSVGIGTNSPNALLHINGSQVGIRVTSNTSAVVHIRGDSGANSFLYFAESGVGERGLLGYAAASGDLVYRSDSSNFSNGT
jgi:hypothetical protein